jgi:hypothetical protein
MITKRPLDTLTKQPRHVDDGRFSQSHPSNALETRHLDGFGETIMGKTSS